MTNSKRVRCAPIPADAAVRRRLRPARRLGYCHWRSGTETAAAAMTPAPAAETILAIALLVTVLSGLLPFWPAAGCGWPPPVMKAGKPATSGAALPFGMRRLRLRLLLRLMLRAAVLRLIARRKRLRVARQIRLRLRLRRLRRKARLVLRRRTAGRRRRRHRNCRRRRPAARPAAAPDCCNRGSAGGTVPAPWRSGGNNVRRAGSNFRPPPDRRSFAQSRASCMYFSAMCEAVPRIFTSGPFDS